MPFHLSSFTLGLFLLVYAFISLARQFLNHNIGFFVIFCLFVYAVCIVYLAYCEMLSVLGVVLYKEAAFRPLLGFLEHVGPQYGSCSLEYGSC
jgi:hypothetical protein